MTTRVPEVRKIGLEFWTTCALDNLRYIENDDIDEVELLCHVPNWQNC